MKPNWEDDYEMPAEYDLTKVKMVGNPFVQRFQELNLVSLDDDVKAVFPDSEAVNTALRSLIKMQRESSRRELSEARYILQPRQVVHQGSTFSALLPWERDISRFQRLVHF